MKKRFFIAGEWLDGSKYHELKSPYSKETIAKVPLASEEDVDKAIQAAFEAKREMKNLPAHQRADILENVSKLIEENREQCARTISIEAGKPIKTARGEVTRTIMTYKFASEEARRIPNEMINMDAAPGGEGRVAYSIREPAGVVAAITPFNFPMNLVAHKLGPAIAAGNPVVLKPASQTPLSAYLIAEFFHRAGLPKGGLNVITGKGSIIGNSLVTNPKTSVITFTGSPEVGLALKGKAGLKRVTLELGSNSAAIIDKDISVEKIADRLITGAFTYQGQVCISLQRVFVHESLKHELIDKMKERALNLILGNPLDEATDVSALISEADTDRVIAWINEAIGRGAKLVSGGKKWDNIVEPTILVDVDPDTNVSCKEVFGPVVTINSFSKWQDAIDAVNNSNYGLQAGVFTKDISKAFQASEELEVGGVMINDIPTFRVDHMPYGGVKQSGFGREGIKYAIEEMTEMKLVTFKK
ncbi:aldehyde dehydrogenase family protein [Bacillus alkalicola]|uniref:Aldehyde dehydrogenase family protein n=1 Tax=Evansella alkalicola TaxID=745819 RepID=A0ABS6JNB2_9BACI|nr:aldehyde dehydrogenase family protein [Bacillus alkalicola]